MGEIVARQAGEGTPIWMLGGLYEVKASGKETDGQATVMEMTIPAGMGPPPHIHPGPEIVYILEGTVQYHVEGRAIPGGPGSLFYIPEGLLENFEPTSDVRVLVTYLPGGIDEFFEAAGEPAGERTIPPTPDGPPDVERLQAIGARFGMEIPTPV
ncbi:MAG: cupin domain-containing protein [Acidimicrobiia bacterium]|nr:cupin domain-containing protein [Acidimicrobiia bacterium]